MRKFFQLRLAFVTVVLIVLNMSPAWVGAVGQAPQLSAPNGLVVTELKITGDEFVVIQNNTGGTINDLSSYWLYAFNKTNPSETGASSSGQQLPVGTLNPGETVLLSDKARATCGATMAGSLSVSLGDANGYLEIMKQTSVNGLLAQVPGDTVSWGTDSTATGTVPKVPSNTTDPAALYYRAMSVPGGWQLADLNVANACQLDALITSGTTTTKQPVSSLASSSVIPPATIASLEASDSTNDDTPTLPISDNGLSAPVVNELLANPMGTGNDASDEFIELYNPNAVSFDLSGFILQSGTTTKHNFTFHADTRLAPKSFTAFFSSDTSLSLSNSGGQVALLDPFGNVLNQSNPYGSAKDGEAWALAKGTWYWTSDPTPNAANVIKQMASTSSKKAASKSSKSSNSSVKGASTAGSTTGSSNLAASNDALQVTPIHPWTLAVVAMLAVAYGIYEYRLDLANRFYRLRKHYADRRGHRQPA